MKDKVREWIEAYKAGKMSKEELEDLIKGEESVEEIKKLIEDD